MPTHASIHALRTAVPYIRAYSGRTFVVKLGGALCDAGPVLDQIVDQVALLVTLGVRVVVVHGGGEQVSAECRRRGIAPQMVAGRRVTDDATLTVVKQVLAGEVNTDLVAAFRKSGVPAVGLTGIDGQLITVVRRPVQPVRDPASGETRTVDFGHVGDVTAVDCGLIEHLLAQRYVPVVTSLAADATGAIHNVNADTVAARIAIGVGAVKYFLLTGVDGVLRDVNDARTLVGLMDLDDLERMTTSGAISGGMLPKLAACAEALRAGVPRTHIINGAAPDTLLAEVFTNEGCGTLLVARRDAPRSTVTGAD